MSNAWHYLEGAWESVKPTMVISWVIISYVLFPTEAYVTAAIGVAGAMVLDILTKYYALATIHGGNEKYIIKRLWVAIVNGHIRSAILWKGTVRKFKSYLVVMILVGLAMRVSPIAKVAESFALVVYTTIFIREAQSVIENMIQAGFTNLKFLLIILKKKEKSLLEDEIDEEK